MKIRLDEWDVEKIAEDWFELLMEDVKNNKAIDESDCRYIADLMLANPKMERLIPCIIKELLGYYEAPLELEF